MVLTSEVTSGDTHRVPAHLSSCPFLLPQGQARLEWTARNAQALLDPGLGRLPQATGWLFSSCGCLAGCLTHTWEAQASLGQGRAMAQRQPGALAWAAPHAQVLGEACSHVDMLVCFSGLSKVA